MKKHYTKKLGKAIEISQQRSDIHLRHHKEIAALQKETKSHKIA